MSRLRETILLRSGDRSIPSGKPVYLNSVISGRERLLREVGSALQRRRREESQARRSVELQLRSEMCESLTAVLLSCELAMAVPKVPPTAAGKILAEDNLAREMRWRLGANERKKICRQLEKLSF